MPQPTIPITISSFAPNTRDEATIGMLTAAAATAEVFKNALRLLDFDMAGLLRKRLSEVGGYSQ